MLQQVLTFAAFAALIIIVPGPDIALITRTAVSHGRAPALAVCAGTVAGILFHATIAVLGVTAVIASSHVAFTVLRVAGALYLVYLGVVGIRDLIRSRASGASPDDVEADATEGSTWRAFRQGVLSNALNPKVAVFFLTFIPQFLDPHRPTLPQTLALSGTFLGIACVWHTTYALLILQLRAVLGRPAVRRGLEAVTSVVLVGLGIRLGFALL